MSVSFILFIAAAICFLLAVISIPVKIDLLALGLLLFVLGHLPWADIGPRR